MATLISLANYKVWAGISGTGEDTKLTLMLEAASAEIRRWCGRNLTNGFESATRTENYDGTNGPTIQLIEWPITSITSVAERTADGTSTTLAATTYRVQATTGILSRVDVERGRFTGYNNVGGIDAVWGIDPNFIDGFQNIVVVYVGGYSTIPSDLQVACAKLTDMSRATAGANLALNSESIGQYSYTRANAADYETLQRNIINAYRSGVV